MLLVIFLAYFPVMAELLHSKLLDCQILGFLKPIYIEQVHIDGAIQLNGGTDTHLSHQKRRGASYNAPVIGAVVGPDPSSVPGLPSLTGILGKIGKK